MIFFGQGSYFASAPAGLGQRQRGGLHNQSPSSIGELMFISNSGNSFYQPHINQLKAKNTLFISLGDYTERAFERAFDSSMRTNRDKFNGVKVHADQVWW